MAKEHPLADIVKEMSGEFKDLRKEAKRSKVTPLGKQKVSRQEVQQRFNQLSPDGREKLARQMIQEMGIDKFMDTVRGKNAQPR